MLHRFAENHFPAIPGGQVVTVPARNTPMGSQSRSRFAVLSM